MLLAIPAFMTAMRDRAIRGQAREVYLWLADRLDLVEYRVVKHEAVSRELAMSGSTVSRSIDALCNRGYIDRGAHAYSPTVGYTPGARGPWTYRLFHSVAARTNGLSLGATAAGRTDRVEPDDENALWPSGS